MNYGEEKTLSSRKTIITFKKRESTVAKRKGGIQTHNINRFLCERVLPSTLINKGNFNILKHFMYLEMYLEWCFLLLVLF